MRTFRYGAEAVSPTLPLNLTVETLVSHPREVLLVTACSRRDFRGWPLLSKGIVRTQQETSNADQVSTPACVLADPGHYPYADNSRHRSRSAPKDTDSPKSEVPTKGCWTVLITKREKGIQNANPLKGLGNRITTRVMQSRGCVQQRSSIYSSMRQVLCPVKNILRVSCGCTRAAGAV